MNGFWTNPARPQAVERRACLLLVVAAHQDDRQPGRISRTWRNTSTPPTSGIVRSRRIASKASGSLAKQSIAACPPAGSTTVSPNDSRRRRATSGPSRRRRPQGHGRYRPGLAGVVGRRGRAIAQRQHDPEGGPVADLAVDAHRAAMAANDPEDRGQAEPSARELRREEGVEDAGLGRRVHARAGVGDLERREPAGIELRLRMDVGQVGRVGVQLADPDRDDAAPVTDRVGGIDHEVHHDLAELGRVGLDDDRLVRELVADDDAPTDRDAGAASSSPGPARTARSARSRSGSRPE